MSELKIPKTKSQATNQILTDLENQLTLDNPNLYLTNIYKTISVKLIIQKNLKKSNGDTEPGALASAHNQLNSPKFRNYLKQFTQNIVQEFHLKDPDDYFPVQTYFQEVKKVKPDNSQTFYDTVFNFSIAFKQKRKKQASLNNYFTTKIDDYPDWADLDSNSHTLQNIKNLLILKESQKKLYYFGQETEFEDIMLENETN